MNTFAIKGSGYVRRKYVWSFLCVALYNLECLRPCYSYASDSASRSRRLLCNNGCCDLAA